MLKKWYNVELNLSDAREFKFFLKKENIQYEASTLEAGILTFFSVFLDNAGKEKINAYLASL